MKPGSVVVDIGTGVGILAVLACHYGAHVPAMEPDDAIEVAREIAATRCGDRINSAATVDGSPFPSTLM
jgi:protein arginine N-methyltransferase 1